MPDFLKTSYKLYANKMTPFNAAMSYNLNNVVTGAYPSFMFDYANTLVSRDNLTVTADGAAPSPNAAKVGITWTDNSGRCNAFATYKALIALLNTTRGEAV